MTVASVLCAAASNITTRPASRSATKPYAPSKVIATAAGPPANGKVDAGSAGMLNGALPAASAAGRSTYTFPAVGSGT